MTLFLKICNYILFLSFIIASDVNIIQGFLLDEENNPVADAIILSEDTITKSDGNGFFILNTKNIQQYIIINKIGFIEKKILLSNLIFRNKIVLKAAPIKLKDVVITELTGAINLHESTKDVYTYSKDLISVGDNHFKIY